MWARFGNWTKETIVGLLAILNLLERAPQDGSQNLALGAFTSIHVSEPNERPIDKPACGQFVAIDESQLSCYSNPFMNTCKVFLLKVSDTWVWSSSNFLVFKLSLCLGSASSGVSARFHVPGEGQSVTGQHKLQH